MLAHTLPVGDLRADELRVAGMRHSPPSVELEGHGAVAARRVHPVLLDEILAAAERDVVLAAVRRRRLGAEGPGAFVGILCAAIVVPGVEVGIADRLFALMRDDRRHAVGAGVAVGAGALRCAGRKAASGIADERVTYLALRRAAAGMPAAILRAKSARRSHLRRREDEV